MGEDKKIEDVKPKRGGYAEGGRGKGKVVSTAILEKQYSKIKEPDISTNSEDIGNLDSSKDLDTIEEQILENTAWHQIRKGLREELGEAIDIVWFSKAVAFECKETKTLTITMPTRFMSDWVKNNYSHVIRRLSEGAGVNSVEYGYE